jgi:hypothetical protein
MPKYVTEVRRATNRTPPNRGTSSRRSGLISVQSCVEFVVVNLMLEQVQPGVDFFLSLRQFHFTELASTLSMASLNKTFLDTHTQKLI